MNDLSVNTRAKGPRLYQSKPWYRLAGPTDFTSEQLMSALGIMRLEEF